MVLGQVILWVVLAALSARFGMHFAALFRRKQAKQKLHDAIQQRLLLNKRLQGDQGEQVETGSNVLKDVPAGAPRKRSRSSLGDIAAKLRVMNSQNLSD